MGDWRQVRPIKNVSLEQELQPQSKPTLLLVFPEDKFKKCTWINVYKTRMILRELQINIVLWPVGFCSLFIWFDFVCKDYVL